MKRPLLLLAALLAWCCVGATQLEVHKYSGPLYDMVFSDDPLEMPPLDVAETIEERIRGVEYICYVPRMHVGQSARAQPMSPPVRDPSLLWNPLKMVGCMVRTEAWWTYEFCFGASVKQFHLEEGTGERVSEYVLGRFDIHASVIVAEPALKHVRQAYVNGELCDLTRRPRTVEVRFVCNERAGPLSFIERIEEPGTCGYVMTVVSPIVCQYPEMRDEPKSTPKILCKEKP